MRRVFLAALVVLLACGPSETTARTELEGLGFTEIQLTRAGDHFDFSARKADTSCSGRVLRGPPDFSCTDPPCGKDTPWICHQQAITLRNAGDQAASLALLESACEVYHVPSCLIAAEAYDRGKGVTADQARARGFYDKGCRAADAVACEGLAKALHRDGQAEESTKAHNRARAIVANEIMPIPPGVPPHPADTLHRAQAAAARYPDL